jgi:hypothetical protein
VSAYPQKRTWIITVVLSALSQKQTKCVATNQGVLFDHLVCAGQQSWGDYKPERFGRLQVDEFREFALGGGFAPADYAGPCGGLLYICRATEGTDD